MDQKIRVGDYWYNPHKDKISQAGASCIVYIGHSNQDPSHKVAIKVLKKDAEQLSGSQYESIMQQFRFLKNINSNGAVKAYDVQLIKQNEHLRKFALVLQLMDGSLTKLIAKYSIGDKGLQQQRAKDFLRQIVNSYRSVYQIKIEKKHIIHRDLKPGNILYRKLQQEKYQIKIADFGIATLEFLRTMTPEKGTKYYMSPQQARSNKYTTKADVYALGVIFFEMLCGLGKLPMELELVNSKRQTNHKEIKTFLSNIQISDYAIQFIQGCLMQQQVDRLSWEQIFNHQYFKVQMIMPQLKLINKNPEELKIEQENQKGTKVHVLEQGKLFTIPWLQLGKKSNQTQLKNELKKYKGIKVNEVYIINDRFDTAVNDIETIKELGKLKNVTKLQIRWCKKMEPQVSIEIISQMPHLKHLALLQFKKILSENFMKKLCQFKQLKSFRIDYYSDPEYFRRWRQDAYFLNFFYQDNVPSIKQLLELSKLPKLENIEISQPNQAEIELVITNMKEIKHLALGYHHFHNDEVDSKLIKQVGKLRDLITLSLIGLKVDSKQINHIIASNLNLKTIIIRNEQYNENIDDEAVKHMTNLIQLQNLCIVRNIKITAEHLNKLNSLIMLQVVDCTNINKKMMKQTLLSMHKLQHLNLQYNEWFDKEVVMSVQSCEHLSYLNIACTSFLGEDLKNLKKLNTLICGDNKINAKNLIQLTKQSPSITRLGIHKLNLNDNQLLQISANCQSMTHLNIKMTNISVEALLKIKQLKVVKNTLDKISNKRLNQAGIKTYKW